MTISERINDAKKGLEELQRQHKFKLQNNAIQKEAQLLKAQADCRGKLELCKTDFDNDIRRIAKNIADGEKDNQDTSMLEGMLWDAALGYMLVKDAIFAISTVSTNDSISHAYYMLEEAMKQISNRGVRMNPLSAVKFKAKRNAYGFASSREVVKEKKALLEEIYADLKRSGDIEGCLSNSLEPSPSPIPPQEDSNKRQEEIQRILAEEEKKKREKKDLDPSVIAAIKDV